MSQLQQNQPEEENDWMLVSPPRSRSNSPADRNDDSPPSEFQAEQPTRTTNEALPILVEEEDQEPQSELNDIREATPAKAQNDALTEIDLNVDSSSSSICRHTKPKRSVRFLSSLKDPPSTLENVRPTQTKADKTTSTTSNADKPEAKCSAIVSKREDQASKQKRSAPKTAKQRTSPSRGDITDILLLGLICVLCPVLFCGYRFYQLESEVGPTDSARNNEVGSLVYPEVLLLNEELMDCIKRDNLRNLPEKGFICYEREKEWRKKFDRLKMEKNLDLAKIIRQTKKQITLKMLQKANPMLQFDLILNQLEYLEYLDQRRKDATIDRLKADNFALRNRLNERLSKDSTKANQGHDQNSLANVEFENLKLRRENEALKVSLGEKAGTVYVKQSIELEKCERQNSALRKFHQQVAQEVAKGLKQLDLNTMDAAAILNDHESLESQLALTRGYLLRYGEEVGNLIARNKILMDELRETTQLVVAATGGRQIDDQSVNMVGQTLDLHNETNSCSLSSAGREGDKFYAPGECWPGKCGEKPNWLMRRAKLRERLRKATGIDVFEKHIEHIIGTNKSHRRHGQQDSRAHEKHRQAKVAKNKHHDHHYNKQSEHKRNNHHHHHHHHQQPHISHRFRDEL